jgi:hypothetical protein
MRMHNTLLLVAALAGAAVVTAAGCGENAAPDRPSYARDIAPLMGARCVRCHGAGGQINADPDMPPIMGTITKAPMGDFTTLAGLMPYANRTTMKLYVVNIGMPPAPSDPLDDWSLDMLLRWCDMPLP